LAYSSRFRSSQWFEPAGGWVDPEHHDRPTIAALTRDVLRAIPNSQREASLSLGATVGR